MKTLIEYKPCANAPLKRTCDMPDCSNPAIVDAKMEGGSSWGYFCNDDFVMYASKNPELVNNITDKPIFYSRDDMNGFV